MRRGCRGAQQDASFFARGDLRHDPFKDEGDRRGE